MNASHTTGPGLLAALAVCTLAPLSHAQLLTNAGFESGLFGWTTANQIGGDGNFFPQQGTQSPISLFAVPAPPQGARAAMTDSSGPGGHALYQDFVVPADVTSASLGFSLFLNNTADAYFIPPTLDWARTNPQGGTNLNQQARVDIILPAADIFSIEAADVLMNLFSTDAQTPLVMGYTPFSFDITSLLQAHAGETLRLRFAETDNVNFFNMGVDDVTLIAIPAPAVWPLACIALAAAGRRGRTPRGVNPSAC